jgi:hypothetical protein
VGRRHFLANCGLDFHEVLPTATLLKLGHARRWHGDLGGELARFFREMGNVSICRRRQRLGLAEELIPSECDDDSSSPSCLRSRPATRLPGTPWRRTAGLPLIRGTFWPSGWKNPAKPWPASDIAALPGGPSRGDCRFFYGYASGPSPPPHPATWDITAWGGSGVLQHPALVAAHSRGARSLAYEAVGTRTAAYRTIETCGLPDD